MEEKQTKQLHPNDILCDNQASVSIFLNKDLVSNIRNADKEILVRGVGGVLAVKLEEDVKRFGKVYFHPESLANILCFYHLANKKMITYDDQKYEFVVTAGEKKAFFKPIGKLYVYRTFTSVVNEGTVVISTVWENIAGFTKREIDHAKLPRQLQVRLEYPSVADILNSIKSGRIWCLIIIGS